MFLPQEAGTFGNTIKGTAKATLKIEIICILYIYKEYLLCLQSSAGGSSLQKRINFVKQQLKFSPFKGSIVP